MKKVLFQCSILIFLFACTSGGKQSAQSFNERKIDKLISEANIFEIDSLKAYAGKASKDQITKAKMLFFQGLDAVANKQNPLEGIKLYKESAQFNPDVKTYYYIANALLDANDTSRVNLSLTIASQLNYDQTDEISYTYARLSAFLGDTMIAVEQLTEALQEGFSLRFPRRSGRDAARLPPVQDGCTAVWQVRRTLGRPATEAAGASEHGGDRADADEEGRRPNRRQRLGDVVRRPRRRAALGRRNLVHGRAFGSGRHAPRSGRKGRPHDLRPHPDYQAAMAGTALYAAGHDLGPRRAAGIRSGADDLRILPARDRTLLRRMQIRCAAAHRRAARRRDG